MEPAAPPSDLVSAEGRNRKAVLCQRCGSRVLQPGTALFSRRQVRGRGGGGRGGDTGSSSAWTRTHDRPLAPRGRACRPRGPDAGPLQTDLLGSLSVTSSGSGVGALRPAVTFRSLLPTAPPRPAPGVGAESRGGGSGRGNWGAVRRDWAGGHGVGRDGTRGPSWGRGPNPQSARSLPGL